MLGIVRLYTGGSGSIGYYNLQELALAKSIIANSDLDVIVFLLRERKQFPDTEIINIDNRIRIVYLPACSIGTHGIINPKFLRNYGVTIVHLNSDAQIYNFRIINWCLKNKIQVYAYVGTLESDSRSRLRKYISRIIFNLNKISLNRIYNIAKTPYVFDELIKKRIKNIKLIPVGLDLTDVRDLSNKDSRKLREKYGLPLQDKLILFVGRLEEYKNPLMALDIFKHIVKGNSRYSLLMVGNGPLKEKIISEVKNNSLEDNFFYIEKVPNNEIGELYRTSDVLINMNDREIYGMSILEAMYQKCPVVAVEAPGPKFIIDNEKTGYIINGFNLEEWRVIIEKAIENRKYIGNNANKKIIGELNSDTISKKYISLYEELLGK